MDIVQKHNICMWNSIYLIEPTEKSMDPMLNCQKMIFEHLKVMPPRVAESGLIQYFYHAEFPSE
jgi:hypothetical protein